MKFLRVFLESSLSIIPIVAIILILSLSTLTPLIGGWDYLLLIVGALVLIIGLSIFSIGSSRSLSKVGEHMGASLSKQNNIWIVILVSFLLGALVTCAEPSIMILAELTPMDDWMLILFISVGVGLFVALGVIRVFKRKSLKWWLITLYGIVFGLCLIIDSNQQAQYLPLIFDASGATTGSATVPFLLSLGSGVAMVRAGKKAKEESFGLVAISSVGPIISMVIMVIINTSTVAGNYDLGSTLLNNSSDIFTRFYQAIFPTFDINGNILGYGTIIEVLVALLPIMVVFFIYQKIFIKLPKGELIRISLGFLYSYLGLVLFLSAVSAVMMPFGIFIGQELGNYAPWVIILIFFIIGLVSIMCEPAIHVLTKQIEQVSDGGIKKSSVLLTLSIGVGVAIGLCAIRAIYKFSIAYYIIPGYLIALGLTFLSPNLFTALAFDSGGVASGPMTVSFLLPLTIGMYASQNNIVISNDSQDGLLKQDVLTNCFGVIAMVAMTPLIAIQILGIIIEYKKYRRQSLYQSQLLLSDNEVIHF